MLESDLINVYNYNYKKGYYITYTGRKARPGRYSFNIHTGRIHYQLKQSKIRMDILLNYYEGKKLDLLLEEVKENLLILHKTVQKEKSLKDNIKKINDKFENIDRYKSRPPQEVIFKLNSKLDKAESDLDNLEEDFKKLNIKADSLYNEIFKIYSYYMDKLKRDN